MILDLLESSSAVDFVRDLGVPGPWWISGGGDKLQRHQQGLGRGRVEVTYHLEAFEYYL